MEEALVTTTGQERGQISIHAENILPIIKRWLYSEKEIFLRELVANAADAIHKLSKLQLLGEAPDNLPEGRITISIDKSAKTLTFTDTGLGMTADEIRRYINQVAFSGVRDFVEKYKDKDDEQQIIGHFGLGFYSAYMVASRVEIDTLSWQPGAAAAHWSCDGSTEFVLTPSARTAVGTSITLHISDDCQSMLESEAIRGLVNKYCAFIKVPIEMNGAMLNDPQPLWTKSSASLSDKDYTDFFHKVFPGSPDPLFWIHLNVDHPFKLRGVLYFPRLRHENSASEGQIKLYCNQVFVADNCKELVPEFLLLLKGVIDCPDLPLNVSRSWLQSDQTVQLIAQHITKKVADKLSGMAKTEAEKFNSYLDDLHGFIKFGMLKDQKFYERMIDHLPFKTSKGEFLTLGGYTEAMKDKTDGSIIYSSDAHAQASLIRMLEDEGVAVILAESLIDSHFLPWVEYQSGRKFKFLRVDADVSKHLVSSSSTEVSGADGRTPTQMTDELFRKYLDVPGVKIRVESLKSSKVPTMLVVDENMRRFQDMARTMGQGASLAGPPPEACTLVVNQTNPAVRHLSSLAGQFNREDEVKMIVRQMYDLAWLQQGKFTAEMLQGFLERSTALLERVVRTSGLVDRDGAPLS
jgi:molecular chaperone HtpG